MPCPSTATPLQGAELLADFVEKSPALRHLDHWIDTLPKTNGLTLKKSDGWKMNFLLGFCPIFQGRTAMEGNKLPSWGVNSLNWSI